MPFHVDLYNVFVLAFGYFFYDASFTTTLVSLKYLIDLIKEDNPNFKVEGYRGQSIIFFAMAVCTLFAAIVVNKMGPRAAIITAGCCQLVFNIQFFIPMTALFYLGAAFRGFASSIYDTAKGRYLTQNSTTETLARNAAIYGWIQSLNRVLGNLFFFIKMEAKKVTKNEKNDFFIITTFATVMAIIFFCLMRKAKYNAAVNITLKESCRYTWNIYALRDIWLLFPMSAFSAVHFAFAISMYGTGLGYTEQMSELPEMRKINLAAMMFGAGGFTTGVIISIFGKKMTRKYFFPIVLTGYCISLFTMILVFINLPKDCIHERTKEDAFIKSNLPLAVVCAYLFGLGDACVYASLHAIVGFLFKERVSYAFAAMKLFGSFSTAIFNLISKYLNLYSLIAILIILGALAVGLYIYSELYPSVSRKLQMDIREEEQRQAEKTT